MKIRFTNFVSQLMALLFLALASATSQAGISVSFNINYISNPGQTSYYIQMPISTTNVILSSYQINSPHTNFQASLDSNYNGFNGTFVTITRFSDLMSEVTNGNWTLITDVGTGSQRTYTFRITAHNFASNNMPPLSINNPTPGQLNVDTNVVFTWLNGPTDYTSEYVQVDNNGDYFDNDSPNPPTQSSFTPDNPLSTQDGDTNFTFHVNYQTSGTNFLTISTPVDSFLSPVPGWASTSTLTVLEFIPFSIASGPDTPHFLVAHYTFDNNSDVGMDSSGNGNDYNAGGSQNGGGVNPTNDAEVGGGALQFFRNSLDQNSAGFQGWSPSTPSQILSALAGSFSVSVWVKTTNSIGGFGDFAFNGSAVLAADVGGLANDTVPISLVGGGVGFNTGGNEDDTLSSNGSVNNGGWHYIVVTRDQTTGNKVIYIDGQMDTSGTGTTNFLNDPKTVTIGAITDAGNPTFNGSAFYGGFDGEMDDLQIYSGVLSQADIHFLFTNPGQTAANVSGVDFNPALNTTNLNWATLGNSSWFVEATNTFDGVSAAQSGPVTFNQQSTLQLSVTGPGTITFHWQTSPNGDNFNYEFNVDGNDMDDLGSGSTWQPDGPFNVGAGSHTFTWVAQANGDDDPTEAAYLDQVNYIQIQPPTITLSPFSQTNYPGYNVGLFAGATSNVAIDWQWYEVGVGAISYATNAQFIPTNSGTAGVAGSYYAIASTAAGTATTGTAVVSFVNAPLPPDWSRAFKSPFQSQDESQVTKDFYYGAFVDASSNIYTATEFGGNETFNNTNVSSGAGGDGAAIVKQSPTGAPIWAQVITNNGTGFSSAFCVAPAPSGGAYLAGDFGGSNFLGTNALHDNGNGDIFIARFAANGSNVWLRTFGTANNDFIVINSMASDPSGNVTLSGLLGGGPVTIGASNYNVVGQQGILVQYDQNGAVRWSQLEPGGDFAEYLAYSSGRLYVSVNTYTANGTTNMALGGVTNITDRSWALACLNETNGQDIWIHGVGARYNSATGNPLSIPGRSVDDVPRLAVAGDNVFLTGVAYDTNATFGAVSVNFPVSRGEYVARYDTNGVPQVATAYGSATCTPIAAVTDITGNNLYVAGDFEGSAFFGNDLAAAPVERDPTPGDFSQGFLAKFDHNGNALWARVAVSPATVNFLGIAQAPDGVWASGYCISSNINNAGYAPTVFGTNSVFGDLQIVPLGIQSIEFIGYPGGVLAKVTEPRPTVSLTNFVDNQTTFQFSFQSQSGLGYNVQYATNLISPSWNNYTNVPGDGSVKTLQVPLTLFNGAKQGFVRIHP